ncbi:hypothetical protein GCM10009716_11210 [Streptomyces sodiiphilus]|uniref:Uncharacterized protein n=1 Tax=Streptomyces sodiiphilus TaxID=226217 RepID=A0ABN2NWF5_9ACTN
MTRLSFAGPGDAAGLAAFLGRQLRWDKAAAVRLQAGDGVAALFTRPARFEVLAVLPVALREGVPEPLDRTVSAGELLHGIDEQDGSVLLPGPVTGPPWAGLLPPRGGWEQRAEMPASRLREAAAAVVAEFKERTEALPADGRTRSAVDALAEEIWSRPLPGTQLPSRAVHAAHALGFLRTQEPGLILSAGSWLRLRTAPGSVAVRRGGGPSLGVMPL